MGTGGWVVVAALLAASNAGCSSGSASSGADGGHLHGGFDGGTGFADVYVPCTGLVGTLACDAGVEADGAVAGCMLSMPLSGGLSGTLGDGCGASTTGCGSDVIGATTDGMNWSASLGSEHLTVHVAFSPELMPDQTGSFPATITLIQPTGGGQVEWQTPTGGCTVTIAGSDCSLSARQVAESGSGTCSQPAAPTAGNPGSPVTIGDFTFTGHLGASLL